MEDENMTKLQDFGLKQPIFKKNRFEIIKVNTYIVKDLFNDIDMDRFVDINNDEFAFHQAKKAKEKYEETYGKYLDD